MEELKKETENNITIENVASDMKMPEEKTYVNQQVMQQPGQPIMQQPTGYVNGYPVMPQPQYYRKKQEAPMLVALRENFAFYGLATLIYAIFFTFCLYKNAAGITAPFFIVGTLCYCFLCLKKLGVPIKKDAIFYVVSIILLGVSLCLTLDPVLIFFNYIGIILLGISGIIHLFYEDKDWELGKYFSAIQVIIFGTITKLFRAFSDCAYYSRKQKGTKKNEKAKYVVIGFFAALPILFLVVMLLSSADSVFSNLIHIRWSEFENISTLFGILWMFALAYLITYGMLAAFSAYEIPIRKKEIKTYEPTIAITINCMLAVVYLLFSGIQIIYLFIGNLQLPEGMSYATYARQGFFQLLAVCVINLILVLISLYYFGSSRVLKGVLTVITACTYIMIASSALRMYMYVEAYNLSYLRLLTFWMLALLTFLMTGILIYCYLPKFPLFRYSMVVFTVCYLALSFAHPSYLIAKYNLRPGQEESLIDIYYLRRSSPDAAKAILECIEEERYLDLFDDNDIIDYMLTRSTYYENGDSIRHFNYAGEDLLRLESIHK